ncbi:hypothetical protein M378DRAFT_86295 [Amanita muscaria Koide BX008]|uniref:Uncharacterized protein n=1 Tax=Amanita muscaria (strain Koide BX008) TaxID=946122 RepID=A0A0C2WPE7_AMAMK|nr:hypothetical protein M378DRAFT_86295 [Amanita muscaria Koide BX008]
MSNYKETHYWTQLRTTLTAGQWAAKFPAKTPTGSPLSWPELVRKFNKHCAGFRDVSEMASYTRTLALLLASRSVDNEDDNTKSGEEFPLSLGDECVLPEEHVEEGRTAYEALKRLETRNVNSHKFVLAYYAYALRNYEECLSHLVQVQDICNIREHIPIKSATSATSATSGTLAVPAPSTRASMSMSSMGGSSYAAMLDCSLAEIKDGRGWAMTEAVRSICLEGLSYENLSPSDPQKSLSSYGAALPLIKVAASEFAFNRPTSPTAPSFRPSEPTPFMRFRELWRWVDRLIWRAIVICARTSNVLNDDTESVDSLWTWLQLYLACSVNWTPNFRSAHRSTISIIYLRALVLRHGQSLSSLPLSTTPVSSRAKKLPPWFAIARSVISSYRDILQVSTKFPRAGQHNVKVEDFVDLTAAVWEAVGAYGEHAAWLIDIMWWATRLTFNSPRVFRHLTRLLFLSGDAALGKRTLRLYAQIVGKAWQTNNAQVSEETDTSENWVELLVFGVRMLCKKAAVTQGLEGMKEAREAGQLIEKARARLDASSKKLVAYVDMAEGIWHTVMAACAEQDPFTRPERLEKAHNLFRSSVEMHSTALGYFYLALSFARAGVLQDLPQAIVYAGQAVETDATEVRYWHLLGILLSTAEQWKAAVEILERGAALDDAENFDPTNGVVDGLPVEKSNTDGLSVPTRDYPPMNGHASSSNVSTEIPDDSTLTPTRTYKEEAYRVLDRYASKLPSSSDLLGSIVDQCWPLCIDIFEHSLQLRLTQVAITEAVEGPEGADQKWVEVFAWIAAKKAAINDGEPSVDLSNKSPPIFVAPLQPSTDAHPLPENTAAAASDSPILITVAPPTEKPLEPEMLEKSKERDSSETTKDNTRVKRSMSIDRGDTSKSKKVQQLLKTGVHKGQERITTISKKIGHGVTRGPRRTNSTPDLRAVLQPTLYQASSIHSRRRVGSIFHQQDRTPTESPTPPPPPPPVPPVGQTKKDAKEAKENKMLSDVWLMSAATFRRLGKIDQAKGAIQEAEVRDEGNPAVWVQLALYYLALGQRQHALDALQKALFVSSEDVSATVHLARLHLMPEGSASEVKQEDIDLAAGLLSHLTRGVAWDVPEAWYFLAKAYGMQGRRDRERECLAFALELSEHRGVREISSAIGWCI